MFKSGFKKSVFTNTARSPICFLIEETRDGKKKKKGFGESFWTIGICDNNGNRIYSQVSALM